MKLVQNIKCTVSVIESNFNTILTDFKTRSFITSWPHIFVTTRFPVSHASAAQSWMYGWTSGMLALSCTSLNTLWLPISSFYCLNHCMSAYRSVPHASKMLGRSVENFLLVPAVLWLTCCFCSLLKSHMCYGWFTAHYISHLRYDIGHMWISRCDAI